MKVKMPAPVILEYPYTTQQPQVNGGVEFQTKSDFYQTSKERKLTLWRAKGTNLYQV
jgi:hypothetical protein